MIGEKEVRDRRIHVVYPQMDMGIHKLAKLNGLLDSKKTERILGAVPSVQFAGVESMQMFWGFLVWKKAPQASGLMSLSQYVYIQIFLKSLLSYLSFPYKDFLYYVLKILDKPR